MLKDIWEVGKLGELVKKIGGEFGDGGWEVMGGG